MSQDEIFVYDGVRRMMYGFVSPNQAGAVLAGLLPVFWALLYFTSASNQRRQQILLSLGEQLLFFAVCLTLSRGALVSIGVAAVYVFALRCMAKETLTHDERWGWAVRPVSYLFLAGMAGLLGRTALIFGGNDASSANRLDYWHAGILAFQSVPLLGTRPDTATEFFMNWMDALDSDRRIGGFVNSYLEVGVVAGPLVLVLLLALIAWSVGYPFLARREVERSTRSICLALSGCTVVLASSCFFSSFAGVINVLGLLLLVALINTGLSTRMVQRTGARFALITAGVAAVVVALLRVPLQPTPSPVVDLSSSGSVLLARDGHRPNAHEVDILLVWDSSVPTNRYGKEARRLFEECEVAAMCVVPPSAEAIPDLRSKRLVCFGERWKSLPRLPAGQETVLLHPLGPPDAFLEQYPGKITIVLPAIDEAGFEDHWTKLASKKNYVLKRTAGGHQLLEDWTRVMGKEEL